MGAPNFAVVADFNNDGKPDIAVAGSGGASVWLGNGDGTFRSRVDFQLRSQDSGVSLAAGDFNRDGKQDLAVSGGSTGTSIFLGNGDGTFTFQAAYPTGGGTIIAVDLNNDGKSDLAVVNQLAPSNALTNSVTILLGNGDGTFQSPVSYATGVYPFGVVEGDFNGDGQMDLAVSDANCATGVGLNFANSGCAVGSVTVFLGAGHGIFGGAPIGGSTVGTLPAFLLPVDVNGDGKPDVVVVNQGDDTVSVLLANGDGTFQPQVTYPTGHLPVSVQAGDFNGDGKMDLVVVDQICAPTASSCSPGAVSVLLGKGDGTFQAHADFAVGLTPVSAAVGDFNGDGKLDLAVANNGLQLGNTVSVLLGHGDGTFAAAVNYSVGRPPLAVVAGDFNKDGKLDLAVNTPTVPSTGIGIVSILLGVGDGTFMPHVDFAGGGNSSTVVGDFNNDTIPDLAVGVASGNGFSVFLSNGNGTFRAGGTGGIAADSVLATGDFDADGKLDVATVADTPRVGISRGNGDGTFQPKQDFLLPGSATLVATADFDGDDGLDLAVFDGVVSTILNPPFKSVSPNALTFGSQGVATTSATRTVTLGNPSGAPYDITGIAISGDYSQTNNCGAKLTPGQSCTINVQFVPTTVGSSPGAITLTDSTHASPQMIALSGSGVNGPFLQLSPTHLSLASTAVGNTSSPRTVMLTNAGNATLSISKIGIASGNVGDFTESNTCGSSLAAGAACSVSVTFAPTAGGTRMAALTITDGGPGSPQTVNLSGISLSSQVTLSPTSLTFSAQATGTTSPSQIVTLGNTGDAALTIAKISTSGDFAQTNNCGASVALAGMCQVTVTFTPTAGGSRTGSLTIADSASGSPHSVALTGIGQDFGLTPTSSATATVAAGTTATYMLSLAGSGGFSGNVALTCSGAPATTACSIAPATVAISGTTATTATVSVTTTARSQLFVPTGNDSPRGIYGSPAVALACVAAMLMLAYFHRSGRDIRLRWGPVWAVVLLVMVGMMVTSCGGGSSGGGGGGTGTAPGTYTITVTATAGGSSHTTQLTLVVQ